MGSGSSCCDADSDATSYGECEINPLIDGPKTQVQAVQKTERGEYEGVSTDDIAHDIVEILGDAHCERTDTVSKPAETDIQEQRPDQNVESQPIEHTHPASVQRNVDIHERLKYIDAASADNLNISCKEHASEDNGSLTLDEEHLYLKEELRPTIEDNNKTIGEMDLENKKREHALPKSNSCEEHASEDNGTRDEELRSTIDIIEDNNKIISELEMDLENEKRDHALTKEVLEDQELELVIVKRQLDVFLCDQKAKEKAQRDAFARYDNEQMNNSTYHSTNLPVQQISSEESCSNSDSDSGVDEGFQCPNCDKMYPEDDIDDYLSHTQSCRS